MKVHAETIEMLIALYNAGHQILEDEYDAEHEGEDAQEGAAIDYMTSKEYARFWSLFDNLDDEVRRELVALMQLGRNRDTYSGSDFEDLKANAVSGPETGNNLFGIEGLPKHWRTALDLLKIS